MRLLAPVFQGVLRDSLKHPRNRAFGCIQRMGDGSCAHPLRRQDCNLFPFASVGGYTLHFHKVSSL